MGRKKGSKNKKTLLFEAGSFVNQAEPIQIKRGRGRPKGAKGKPKEIKETSEEIRRIKKEIRDLRAKKLILPSGSKERIELHRKIKEMKSLLIDKKEIKVQVQQIYNDPEKIELIAEILRLDPLCEFIDLNKYTVAQLEKHISCIKQKRINK